jgi:hypothetical protein
MTAGLCSTKHFIVLPMENGSLEDVLDGPNSVLENGQMEYSKINGLTLLRTNPDAQGATLQIYHRYEAAAWNATQCLASGFPNSRRMVGASQSL